MARGRARTPRATYWSRDSSRATDPTVERLRRVGRKHRSECDYAEQLDLRTTLAAARCQFAGFTPVVTHVATGCFAAGEAVVLQHQSGYTVCHRTIRLVGGFGLD